MSLADHAYPAERGHVGNNALKLHIAQTALAQSVAKDFLLQSLQRCPQPLTYVADKRYAPATY